MEIIWRYYKSMDSYDTIRQRYRPERIKMLLIAESPPPPANIQSSRHFYRSEKVRQDDRLFVNTIKALYPGAATLTEPALEEQKEDWLRKFQQDGWYMIEALPKSLPHESTKKSRQDMIGKHMPDLVEAVRRLATKETKIILIKSNVYDVAVRPLKAAGFQILNTELVDYPGHFNQRAYREKLAKLASLVRSRR